MLGSVVTGDLM